MSNCRLSWRWSRHARRVGPLEAPAPAAQRLIGGWGIPWNAVSSKSAFFRPWPCCTLATPRCLRMTRLSGRSRIGWPCTWSSSFRAGMWTERTTGRVLAKTPKEIRPGLLCVPTSLSTIAAVSNESAISLRSNRRRPPPHPTLAKRLSTLPLLTIDVPFSISTASPSRWASGFKSPCGSRARLRVS